MFQVESSEVHNESATRAELKAAEEAKIYKATLERQAMEAEQLKFAKEAEALERKIAEKPPLEALAERYALKQAQQAQELAKQKLEQMERALMIESGQAEPEPVVEEDNEEDEEDEVEEVVKLTPEQRKVQETIIQQETFNAFNKNRLDNGELEVSMAEWEEIKKKEKASKQQEWFKEENDRRFIQGLGPLDFNEWLLLEAEKKKEKKRAKARERGSKSHQAALNENNEELSGLELAIVPGQMWAAARSGIPEHLPDAVKSKIMKKLMDEVIMRPSPEQEERIRIQALEKDKLSLHQSEECKQGVLQGLDQAVIVLKNLANKLPAVQRRRKQIAVAMKEKLEMKKSKLNEAEQNEISVDPLSETDGSDGMTMEDIDKILKEPVTLDESTFIIPKKQESMQAKFYQNQLQVDARQKAMMENPTNPMLGMMAATTAVTALNTATPQDIAHFTQLGKIAYNLLKKEGGDNGETYKEDEDKKRSKKHKSSKRDRRSRSRSYESRRDRRDDRDRDRDSYRRDRDRRSYDRYDRRR